VEAEPDLTFYAVSAQVLPTLVIALALGLRELRVTRGTWTLNIISAQMVLALVATIASVLVLRSDEEPSQFIEGLVWSSVIFVGSGFIGLIWRWFHHPDDVHSGRAFLKSPPPPAAPVVLERRRRSPLVAGLLGLALLLALRRRA
jgi:hypothetical protein